MEEGSKGEEQTVAAAAAAAQVAAAAVEEAVAAVDASIKSNTASAPTPSSYLREREAEEAPAGRPELGARRNRTQTPSREMHHHLRQTFQARRSSSLSTLWRITPSGFRR